MKSSPDIFFSYAWNDAAKPGEGREKLVNQLYESLVNDGYNVIRDKDDVKYKDFFSDFMLELGKGKCIVVAISDKYLKSSNCMFELNEIARQSKFDKYIFREKILPIMVEFVDFNNLPTRESYFLHWKSKYKEWSDFVRNNTGQLSGDELQDFINVRQIYQNFGKLAKWLADINSLSPQLLSADDFAEIKKAILKYGSKRVSPLPGWVKMPAVWITTVTTIILVLAVWWLKESRLKLPAPVVHNVIAAAGKNLLIVQQPNTRLFGYARSSDSSLFISYKFEEANPFIDGVALVKLNNKYQYIYPDSTNAFQKQYDFAESFKDGKARVANGRDSFYIDSRGQVIVESIRTIQPAGNSTGKRDKPVPTATEFNKRPNGDTCLAICDTKGLKDVEISFRDPRSKKLYTSKSNGRDLEFKVPCYLIEESIAVEITFRSINTTDHRNFQLKHFEIPELFIKN